MIYLMVLTLPLDFVQMMHCHMEQSVLFEDSADPQNDLCRSEAW